MMNEKTGLGYDIFKKLDDGSPFWITQVTTLSEAKEKVDTLICRSSVQYFIRDATTGKVVFSFEPPAG